MGSNYKIVRNGRGTSLEIGPESYASIGKGGRDVMVRGGGILLAFPSWEELLSAVNVEKASYYEQVPMGKGAFAGSPEGGRS